MKVHTTNYFNTLIEVAADCPATAGEIPPEKPGTGSIARIQFDTISRHPYRFTSDDVLLKVYAERNELPTEQHEEAKTALFSKGQACLRASPLARRYGWGIHHNEEGKIALFGVETDEYKNLLKDKNLELVKAMRSKKA
jgi:hypothetical protein